MANERAWGAALQSLGGSVSDYYRQKSMKQAQAENDRKLAEAILAREREANISRDLGAYMRGELRPITRAEEPGRAYQLPYEPGQQGVTPVPGSPWIGEIVSPAIPARPATIPEARSIFEAVYGGKPIPEPFSFGEKEKYAVISPEQYAAGLSAYGDKPEVLKKLLVTTQPGMKIPDYNRAVENATKEAMPMIDEEPTEVILKSGLQAIRSKSKFGVRYTVIPGQILGETERSRIPLANEVLREAEVLKGIVNSPAGQKVIFKAGGDYGKLASFGDDTSQRVYRAVKKMADARMRILTGAQANESEVKMYFSDFFSRLYSPATILSNIEQEKTFFNDFLGTLTSGRNISQEKPKAQPKPSDLQKDGAGGGRTPTEEKRYQELIKKLGK